MAIHLNGSIAITDTRTGKVEISNTYSFDTPEDMAAFLARDLDEMEIQPGEYVPLSGLIDLEDRF